MLRGRVTHETLVVHLHCDPFSTADPGRSPVRTAASFDGLELLQKVSQHYADAKQYSIESTEERIISNDYFRQWSKTVSIAAEEPGVRSHFEGQTQFGDAVEISDGRTIWKYTPINTGILRSQRQRRLRPQNQPGRPLRNGIVASQKPSQIARGFCRTNQVCGASSGCRPRRGWQHVFLCSCSYRTIRPEANETEEKFDQTIWIDKSSGTILKVVERSSGNSNGIAQDNEATTIYPHTVLDSPIPQSLFVFSPPSDAHQVNEFPSAMEEALGATLIGDRVPALKFKAVDGTITPSSLSVAKRCSSISGRPGARRALPRFLPRQARK